MTMTEDNRAALRTRVVLDTPIPHGDTKRRQCTIKGTRQLVSGESRH
jgi:hypothetical protein